MTDAAENPMRSMARGMLTELLDACGGWAAPVTQEPIQISADLAHGLLAHLGASLAGPDNEDGGDQLRSALILAHRTRHMTIVDAAELAEGDASLYAAYSSRDATEADRLMPGSERQKELRRKSSAFNRDAQTCADLARRIRALAHKKGPTPE